MHIVTVQYGLTSPFLPTWIHSVTEATKVPYQVLWGSHTVQPAWLTYLPKVQLLAAHLARQPVGTRVLYLDVDTLLLRDPAPHLKAMYASVAYTPRPGMYMNSGVLGFVCGEWVNSFMRAWVHFTKAWSTADRYLDARALCGGTDQAAFEDMLQAIGRGTWATGLLQQWDFVIMNLCQEWHRFSPKTCVVHFKGSWGRQVLAGRYDGLPQAVRDAWVHCKRKAGNHV